MLLEKSNIFYATNTFNYGGPYTGDAKNKFNESKGDANFFRQVMDYDALIKLRSFPKMYGTLSSNYYTAHISQVRVLDPNFSSVMIANRKKDPEIEKLNKYYDEIYGYSEDNDYYPLLEEIVINNKEVTYADEMLGKWLKTGQGLNDTETRENPFGLFIKQKVEADLSSE